MGNIKSIYLAVTLLAILASNSVLAHGHSHLSIGLGYYGYGGYGFGGYGFGSYGYGYPYYYPPAYVYPQTVIIPTAPSVYIQQQQAQPQTNYWYYCRNPDGYYPYVKNCPEGWLQVAPQPLGQ